jgi:RND family efflux transporter MFP subunit
MKKFEIVVIIVSLFLASCGEDTKNLSVLESKRRELIFSQKEALKKYKKDLFSLDSVINSHPDNKKKTVAIKTIPITVKKVEVKTFEHFFEVHGNVEVVENAALFAEAPGIVKVIHVQEGQTVSKGEVLVSLDAAQLESGIKELEKGLELADKVYGKQKKLWSQKIGSEIQFLEAKNNKESLEQRLVTMREQLDMYKIRAPFSGIVDQINPKVGEPAGGQFPVARIMNLSNVFLEGDVSEAYISSVKKNSFVEVKFPSLGESVKAKVKRVGNFINPANRTFKVKVEFKNPNGKYKPNQLAILKIRDYKAENALIIPSRIVQQDRSGNDYVYTYEKLKKVNRVKKLELQLGNSYEDAVEIIAGLDSSTVLIDKGAKSVQAGDAVKLK